MRAGTPRLTADCHGLAVRVCGSGRGARTKSPHGRETGPGSTVAKAQGASWLSEASPSRHHAQYHGDPRPRSKRHKRRGQPETAGDGRGHGSCDYLWGCREPPLARETSPYATWLLHGVTAPQTLLPCPCPGRPLHPLPTETRLLQGTLHADRPGRAGRDSHSGRT